MTQDVIKEIKLDRLKKLIDIYNSNDKILNRLEKICRICSSSYDFAKIYLGQNAVSLLNNDFYKNNKDKVVELYLFLKRNEENGKVSFINDYIYNEDYLECYDYSKFVINGFINDNSITFAAFLSDFGIKPSVFQFCVETVQELDKELYKKFLSSCKTKNKKYCIGCYKNIKNIINGIKTGYLLDGSKFDEEVFWELVPFKENKSFEKIIRDYVEKNFWQDYSYFLLYLSEVDYNKRNSRAKKILIP